MASRRADIAVMTGTPGSIARDTRLLFLGSIEACVDAAPSTTAPAGG
ncbi:MAG: hypothetical protein JO273_25410 [Methylobacteriaceae bacterium]|nr:hypothetical protein [Methylobacteriaceae bacterium]